MHSPHLSKINARVLRGQEAPERITLVLKFNVKTNLKIQLII